MEYGCNHQEGAMCRNVHGRQAKIPFQNGNVEWIYLRIGSHCFGAFQHGDFATFTIFLEQTPWSQTVLSIQRRLEFSLSLLEKNILLDTFGQFTFQHFSNIALLHTYCHSVLYDLFLSSISDCCTVLCIGLNGSI